MAHCNLELLTQKCLGKTRLPDQHLNSELQVLQKPPGLQAGKLQAHRGYRKLLQKLSSPKTPRVTSSSGRLSARDLDQR